MNGDLIRVQIIAFSERTQYDSHLSLTHSTCIQDGLPHLRRYLCAIFDISSLVLHCIPERTSLLLKRTECPSELARSFLVYLW